MPLTILTDYGELTDELNSEAYALSYHQLERECDRLEVHCPCEITAYKCHGLRPDSTIEEIHDMAWCIWETDQEEGDDMPHDVWLRRMKAKWAKEERTQTATRGIKAGV